MKVTLTSLEGVLIVEPDVFRDDRGFFTETYRRDRYEGLGIGCEFVQDNLSLSRRGTVRGLHYQHPQAQAKLIQAVRGEVFDVCVDIRVGSPRFGSWFGLRLSSEENRQVFVPEGFAHGFCALTDDAMILYKCSRSYAPDCDAGILWSDPEIGIDWPMREPHLSSKDRQHPRLRDVPRDRLPAFPKAGS